MVKLYYKFKGEIDMKKIYYIETTLNGYITKKIEICDWNKSEDFDGEMNFNRDGEDLEYYNDISGDMNQLDEFLKRGSHNVNGYEDELGTKENIYLEYWYTNVLGYYSDMYIGLMIE